MNVMQTRPEYQAEYLLVSICEVIYQILQYYFTYTQYNLHILLVDLVCLLWQIHKVHIIELQYVLTQMADFDIEIEFFLGCDEIHSTTIIREIQ